MVDYTFKLALLLHQKTVWLERPRQKFGLLSCQDRSHVGYEWVQIRFGYVGAS